MERYIFRLRFYLSLPLPSMNKWQVSSRPIAIWLLLGVFMIIVQIILGGITRLTDSGLSITEWKPLLGSIPPTNEQQWNDAFNQYKQIAQYKNIHSYFTLDDFKSIYFWEWLHRLWGRVIGIVFLIPFLVFLLQKQFKKEMIKPMIILFLLGGLQGLIGWIMVKSGLNDEDLYVSHIRLAIHFIAALGLLVYTFGFALQLLVSPQQKVYNPASKKLLGVIIALLIIQLIYGAFMAGLKAATAAPTWPAINGEYWPENMSSFGGRDYSFFSSMVNNPITIHFIHRNLAYLIFIFIILWMYKSKVGTGYNLFRSVKWIAFILICLQLILGIATVLFSPKKIPQQWGIFEWNALLHQFVAMCLLLSLVFQYYLLRIKESSKSTPGL